MFQETQPLIDHSYYCHRILLRTKQCFEYQLKKSIPKLQVIKNTFTNKWSSSLTHTFGSKSSAARRRKGTTKCHICNRRFQSTLNTLYHITHHKEMIYQCISCGNRFMYFHRLKQHTWDTHKVSISDRDENQKSGKITVWALTWDLHKYMSLNSHVKEIPGLSLRIHIGS